MKTHSKFSASLRNFHNDPQGSSMEVKLDQSYGHIFKQKKMKKFDSIFSVETHISSIADHSGSASALKNFHLVSKDPYGDSTRLQSVMRNEDNTPVLTSKRMRSLVASNLIYGNEGFEKSRLGDSTEKHHIK